MLKNRGKSIVGIAASAIIITIASLFNSGSEKTFTHVDYKETSAIHVYIFSGHSSVINGFYDTPGKQSPTWADSLKIYEGYSTKMLAVDLTLKLMRTGIDVTYVNNLSSDMSLYNRVEKVREMWNLDKRIFVLCLHHDAQNCSNGDYTDFEGLKGFTSTSTGGATGVTVFTSPGYSESDNFADNYLLPALKGNCPELTYRNGGKSKEASFYMLTQTPCPSVLIEFNFMTTHSDCLQIVDPTVRNNYTQAICNAFVNYDNYLISKK